VKRIKMLRRVLWAAVAAGWAEECLEAVSPLRGLNPRLDALLDSLTITLSVVAAFWALLELDSRRRDQFRDRKVAAIFTAVGAACEAAGVPIPDQEAAPAEPCMRLVSGKRDSA
jgi:hypothetical protein